MKVMTGPALAAFAVLAIGVVPLHGQLRPEAEVLSMTPPLVMEGLKADPFNYFRFVNRSWIARVCEVFAADLPALGTVRLHGDAHVEQFAFTSNAWGLDDFDDSARGPAPVDIVRFLGSIELAVRQRGWGSHRDALFERFFDGYQRGVLEPSFQSLAPDIVEILRAKTPTSRAAFLAWGETKMEPMVGGSMKAVLAGMEAFAKVISQSRPELPADYFRVIRAGWLRIGVGSVVVPKILARIQGFTSQSDDDELLEGKALRHLAGLCLEETPTSPTLRVIVGTQQIGRLKHNILAAGPELALPEVGLRGQELRVLVDSQLGSVVPRGHDQRSPIRQRPRCHHLRCRRPARCRCHRGKDDHAERWRAEADVDVDRGAQGTNSSRNAAPRRRAVSRMERAPGTMSQDFSIRF